MRLRSPAAAVGALGLVVAVSVGGFIFWNTNVLHDYRTSFEEEELLARYERDYSHLAELDPPRVQAVSLRVDLHPETGDLEVSGVQQLENTTAEPLERMLLRQPPDADVRRLEISRGASLGELDDDLGLRLVDFEPPLAPGERFDVSFDFAWTQRGFPAKGVNTRVVGNGSFVHSPDVLPGYGYQPAGELSTDRTREKHGLEPKERMRDLDDPEGRLENYISTDADWVDFEATVCTSPDQLAIAPGYLVREWEEDGRRCFHHEMDAPILHFFSFLSARYEVTEGRWRDVPIEVYHHPEHEYNVERMIDAAAKSLEYFSTNFSPYQHRQLRIIEFPRYATFAQAFPNTIPFSEGIGFIAKVGEEDIDYPFYVTSHEVAHQWWAHQVIGANVQGSTTLSETLSQYSALMVMEQEYGRARIGDFLRYELDQYLQGRAFETKKELPLLRVENQGYIHYRKGSLIFYRLKEMIGEDRLNAALASLLDEFAFEGPPYPTSRDLLRHLRDVTPEDMQYLLTDSFEHVTLHDLRAEEATWRKTEEGRYEVTLRFEGRKLRAGELGEETEVPLEDHVQVGAWGFEGDDDLVHVETVRLSPDQETLTFTLDEIPRRVGIDPLVTLVDRHPDDNVVEARPAEGSPTS